MILDIELTNGFRLIDLITILAIANLVTEQKIGRDIVLSFFNMENYLNFSGYKRFIFDAASCYNCLSVWVSFGWLLVNYLVNNDMSIVGYIQVPMITLLSAYLVKK